MIEKEDTAGSKEVKDGILVPAWNVPDTWQDDIRDYNNPLIGVNVDSFDSFLGELFTTFELLGLPDRQAKALKGSTRKMAWKWYDKHLPNPSGLASPSLQARRGRQIDSTDIR